MLETVERPRKDSIFPTDLFTLEQRRNGVIIFHILGVIYMFIALVLLCNEYFVPSLEVIMEKLDITDDIVGATFLAAGASAPELFANTIGAFVSFDDIGSGKVVGTAAFNILFVIGMCALFSNTLLALNKWSMLRDCTFFSISLLVLMFFFIDHIIWWWEALILFLIYVTYAVFMRSGCIKKLVNKDQVRSAAFFVYPAHVLLKTSS